VAKGTGKPIRWRPASCNYFVESMSLLNISM
jgi:hypothetical protein